MQKYTKVYFNFFGFTTADFVPCEMCGNKAVDIHHILARSIRKDLENDIKNLMAVCRNCHEVYGDKKAYIDHLNLVHGDYINRTSKNKP